jgi:erythromycin esterase-like protein
VPFRLLAIALLAGCSPVPSSAIEPGQEARSAIPTLPLADIAPLLASIADARFVALGEATHGTHEFYRERARITEQLIRERGFGAVVIEGDWPDAERVNLYVRGIGSDRSAAQALGNFNRFPRWMWRNAEFADFVERLRTHNLTRPPAERAGVYGMDVYNLAEAMAGTVRYLERADRAVAGRVRAHYRCLAPYRGDTQLYGAASRRRSCQAAAEAALTEMRRLPRSKEPVEAEAHFAAVGNARAVVGAEEYFRVLHAGSYSWNARDKRMAQTVGEIADHVGALRGQPGRVIVWAHNSHVGDARATDAVNRGELNLGQLLRQQHGAAAFLLGFLTHSGTVIAAEEWDMPGRVRTLRPALPESYAGLLRATGLREGLLLFRGSAAAPDARLVEPRPERAVGVIYRPETERQSHYFDAALTRQFDAVIYFAETRALEPLK